VYELARETGWSGDKIRGYIAERSLDLPASNFAAVPAELAAEIRARAAQDEASTRGSPRADRAKWLIMQAFEFARASGREPWWRMQAGVMKNRILLVDETFDERDWGARSFSGFLRKQTHLVSVDFDKMPPEVELRPEARNEVDASRSAAPPPTVSAPGAPRRALRRDLWSAIVEQNAEVVYVWDDGSVHAVQRQEMDPRDTRPRLPTATAAELLDWRQAFVARYQSAPSDQRTALEGWARDAKSSWSLPPELRHEWFGELRAHVEERLRSWFEEHSIPIPDDFYTSRPPRAAVGSTDESLGRLRSLVVRCVETMTRSELEELRLPPAAVLRAGL
jgi:hypothetical protein